MKYCVTKPPNEYVEVVNNREGGLFTSYGHDPALFNLLSRVATVVFMYEQGFESLATGTRVNRLHKEQLLWDTLDQSISGVTVQDILKSTTPQEMYDLFIKESPEHLKISELYGNFPRLLQVMNLRVLQYRKYHRGKIAVGKVTKVQFSSDLTGEEDIYLTTHVKELLKVW